MSEVRLLVAGYSHGDPEEQAELASSLQIDPLERDVADVMGLSARPVDEAQGRHLGVGSARRAAGAALPPMVAALH